jgi:hypothetical protein
MKITHEPLRLDEQGLVQWRVMHLAMIFIWITVFFDGAFEYGDGVIFKLLRCMQKLHQSAWERHF